MVSFMCLCACRYDIAARELHGSKALTNFSLKQATENVGESFKVKEKAVPDPEEVAAAAAAKAASQRPSSTITHSRVRRRVLTAFYVHQHTPMSLRVRSLLLLQSGNVAQRPNRKVKGPNRLAKAWASPGQGEFDLEAFPVLRLDQIPRM